jgi:hypothetical protein
VWRRRALISPLVVRGLGRKHLYSYTYSTEKQRGAPARLALEQREHFSVPCPVSFVATAPTWPNEHHIVRLEMEVFRRRFQNLGVRSTIFGAKPDRLGPPDASCSRFACRGRAHPMLNGNRNRADVLSKRSKSCMFQAK